MAAILCHGAGTLCEAPNLPSRDVAKSSLRCGDAVPGGGGTGCSYYMTALRHICTNPFGVFVTVTVVSNIPPMLIALTELGHLKNCRASIWLLINFLFCWVHIVASFYIAISIHNRKPASTPNTNSIFQRAANLFCYDPVIAVYILTVCIYGVFSFVPQWLNLDHNNAYKAANGLCTVYIHEKVIATVGFSWAFLVFGLGALALSFGFAHVDANDKKHPHGHHQSTTCRALVESGTYNTMEEGRHSKSIPRNRAAKGILDDYYVPPMITYHPTTTDVEETEQEGTTVQNDTMTADIGFVTDFETDAETDLGRTSLDTTEYQKRHRQSSPQLLSSFGGNTTSYYDDGTSYEAETDGGNTTDRNYETIDEQTDMEKDPDTSDTDRDDGQNSNVQQDPTISLSLELGSTVERSCDGTDDDEGQRTMSSLGATHDESDDRQPLAAYLNTSHLEIDSHEDDSTDLEPIIPSIGTEPTIDPHLLSDHQHTNIYETDSDTYYDAPDPSLTYSTSMGTSEPLSFVDGGSCNKNNAKFRRKTGGR